MTTLVLSDLTRDEALQPTLAYALSRYRDQSAREVMAERRPRLMGVIAEVAEATRQIDFSKGKKP